MLYLTCTAHEALAAAAMIDADSDKTYNDDLG